MSLAMPRRAGTQKNSDKARLQICSVPRNPPARDILYSSSHGQAGVGTNGTSWEVLATNIPYAPLNLSLLCLHCPASMHGADLLQDGSGIEACWVSTPPCSAPVDTPVPSLTVTDNLELFLPSSPHVLPDEPWEHRVCQSPGDSAPPHQCCQPSRTPSSPGRAEPRTFP